MKRTASKHRWTVQSKNKARGFTISEKALRELITGVAAVVPELKGTANFNEVGVTFVGNCRMRTLNRTYRGKDKTTDVLSFPQVSTLKQRAYSPVLGDIVIALPRAARQAREFRVTLNEEVRRLLVHGFLHLCGYDHEGVSKEEAERMFRLEERILKRLKKVNLIKDVRVNEL